MVPTPDQMAAFAKAARDAVADLDEPLKSEAFRIFLQQMVSGGTGQQIGSGRAALPVKKPPRAKVTGAKKREKQAQLQASTLNLDVAEIKKLREFCAGLDLNGTEQVAFILANFIREHTDLAFVTTSDIAYLHRMLISQKVKVVPVNDPADWSRALGWLTAPSRRKEWLRKSGDGFEVSNSGLIRWHEMEAERKPPAKHES